MLDSGLHPAHQLVLRAIHLLMDTHPVEPELSYLKALATAAETYEKESLPPPFGSNRTETPRTE
jgi:hypothetical protein